jgi:hypothetical protein
LAALAAGRVCAAPKTLDVNPDDKERSPAMAISQPHLTESGDAVAFTVCVDYVKRDCLVSKEVLAALSHLELAQADLLNTYFAYEANINGVARRMVAARVQGTPMRLDVRNFRVAARGY